ncbi:hypothetical protein MASSI9I_50842 [Massilia sp. 9I]|nr:hypothetical protein MASSI9I_50842 [Massilia sp. 9I]
MTEIKKLVNFEDRQRYSSGFSSAPERSRIVRVRTLPTQTDTVSEASLGWLLRASRDPMLAADESGNIVLANKPLCAAVRNACVPCSKPPSTASSRSTRPAHRPRPRRRRLEQGGPACSLLRP